MNREMVKKDNNFYTCKICQLSYKEKKWAERCDAWCRKNKSCNLEITRHAIKSKKHSVKN